MLTEEQQIRYERNILIPGIGTSGQESLSKASVLIIGLGGLGSPAAFYLAAAGIGALGLLDSDTVELSNLQRQILHTTSRIGKPKTSSASETLDDLNPDINLELYQERLTPENARQFISGYSVIVEASDNFETKFLINDTCLQLDRPFISAGILSMSGHAMFVVPGKTPCLRCITPEIPQNVPTTSQLGVLGAVPGILGSIEALEVVRWITGVWKPEPDGCGLLHSVDGDAMRLKTICIPKRKECSCNKET